MFPRICSRVALIRGGAMASTWYVGLNAVTWPWERVIEGGLAAVLQQLEGPPPTGDDADQAGASRPVASRVVRS